MRKRYINFVVALITGLGLFINILPLHAQIGGATLSLSPSSKSITVGETFDVSVFLDTGGNTINTVDIFVKFPSDKLQVVSPSIGKSNYRDLD